MASTGTTAAVERRACVTIIDAKDNTLMHLEGQGNQRGYAMAALLVSIGVMMVLMSVAMPVWRHEVQREKEAELIFRGEQYARAINLYQRKIGPGNFPPSIDFLVQQRFLRKKYKDPITDGDFQIIPVAAGVPQGQPQQSQQSQQMQQGGGRGRGQSPFGQMQQGQQGRSSTQPPGSRIRGPAAGGVRSVRWSVRSVCRRRRPDRRRHHGCRQQEQGHLHPRVSRRDSLRSVDVPVFEREQSSRRRWRSGRARCSRWTAWPWRARRQRKSRPGHSRAEKSRRGPAGHAGRRPRCAGRRSRCRPGRSRNGTRSRRAIASRGQMVQSL